MSVDNDLKDWAERRTAPAPTHAQTEALLARAQPGTSWRLPLALLATAALVGAFVTLLGGGFLWMSQRTVQPLPAPTDVASAPEVLKGHVERDGDVFDVVGSLTVGADGYALVGTVEVAAAPRTEQAPLRISASGYTVQVVGTHFTVVSEPFRVAVTEGVVQVHSDADTWTLTAGDRFANGAYIPVEKLTTAPLPALADLRATLLAGALDEARTGLLLRLRSHPNEVEAWTLLAQTEARAKRTDDAVAAWKKVVALGEPAAAQRARYEAAILLGPTAASIPLLRAFLETSDPLASEARLRLAEALLATGDSQGSVELDRILKEHPGSGAAARAAELRKAIP